jgi:hypothetical protein
MADQSGQDSNAVKESAVQWNVPGVWTDRPALRSAWNWISSADEGKTAAGSDPRFPEPNALRGFIEAWSKKLEQASLSTTSFHLMRFSLLDAAGKTVERTGYRPAITTRSEASQQSATTTSEQSGS